MDMEEAILPTLPHEVMIEILSWLPIKYLWPFRCVSKTWIQLLTADPHFARLHLDRSIQSKVKPSILALQKNDKFFLETEYTEYTNCNEALALRLPSDEKICSYRVAGICHGLLCLFNVDKMDVCIWNPITRDHVTIPNSSTAYLTSFGFGFHRDTKKYKVIRIVDESSYESRDLDLRSHVSVYTLGVDSWWRIIDENIQYVVSPMSTYTPLINEVLHWLVTKNEGISSFSPNVILCFDLKDEVLRELQLPNDASYNEDTSKYNVIWELGGCLCIFDMHEGVDIWLMKEYGVVNSWTKQFNIQRPEEEIFASLRPLGFADNGEIILHENDWELVLHNPETNSTKGLKEFPFKIDAAYLYFGSIVSPRVISRAMHMIA